MTAVAAIDLGQMPIIFGDILLVRDAPNLGTNLSLPGSGQTPGAENRLSDYITPVELCQKVVLISDHLAVGWWGARPIARSLIKELRQNFPPESGFPQMAEVSDFISNFIVAESKTALGRDFGCVWLCKQDPERIACAGFGAKQIELAGGTKCMVGGTGADAIIDALDGYVFTRRGSSEHQTRLLAMIGVLWSDDATHEQNIRQLAFGGGYEIVAPSGDRLHKVGDLLLGQLTAKEIDRDRFLITPSKRFAKLDYLDGKLIIRIVEIDNSDFEWNWENTHPIMLNASLAREAFLIQPVDEPIGSNKVDLSTINTNSLPDLDATNIAFHIDYVDNRERFSCPWAAYKPERNGPIRISVDCVSIEARVLRGTIEQIRRNSRGRSR